MENNPETQAQLFAALAKAQAECRGVEKDGFFDGDKREGGKIVKRGAKYKYASSEAMMKASTEALGKHGLAIVCVSTTIDQTARGCDGMLLARYLLTHEGGGTVSLESRTPIHVGKGRPFDKAVATAKTYDQSYMLRGLLNIPRVDEADERDAQDDQMIAEHRRELAEAKKAEEKARREAHEHARKVLNAKKLRIREGSEDFFKAAGVKRSNVALTRFIQWAAEESEAPRNMEQDGEFCDSALRFLVGWKSDGEADQMSEAQRFRYECYPDSDEDKAAADAAFEKDQELKAAMAKAAEGVKGGK